MAERAKRSRIISICLIAFVAWLGIHSRGAESLLTESGAHQVADALWALTLFLVFGLLFPAEATWRLALGAFALAVLVECSHLYHASWLDTLRSTELGLRALGDGFNPSSLASDAAGVGVGMFAELLVLE